MPLTLFCKNYSFLYQSKRSRKSLAKTWQATFAWQKQAVSLHKIQRGIIRCRAEVSLSLLKNDSTKARRSCAFVMLNFVIFASPISGHSATTEQLPENDLRHIRAAIQKSESFEDQFEAEVWLVGMNSRLKRYVKDAALRARILRSLHIHANQANISPQLVLSVIQIESHFDQFAVSRVGAQGLMQVMPFWKKEIGSKDDNLMDIETNLRYGCAILSHYIKKEKGDLIAALARYNGSVGKTWYPEKVLLAWEKNWFVN